MRLLQKTKQLLTVLLALSLLTACIPELTTDADESSIESNKRALESSSEEPPIFQSPPPQGDAPAHRQSRPILRPANDTRGGEDGTESERVKQSLDYIGRSRTCLQEFGPAGKHLPFSAVRAHCPQVSEAVVRHPNRSHRTINDRYLSSQTMINSISNTTVNVSQRPQEAPMDVGEFIAR